MIPGEAGSGPVPETIVGADEAEVAVVDEDAVLSAWATPSGSVRTANNKTTTDCNSAWIAAGHSLSNDQESASEDDFLAGRSGGSIVADEQQRLAAARASPRPPVLNVAEALESTHVLPAQIIAPV